MGVLATFCQVCGLPVQHDCHVEAAGGELSGWHIHRGPNAAGVVERAGAWLPPPAFGFGPEHAWLCDAVALRLRQGEQPAVLRGDVHDGVMTTPDEEVLLLEGVEERAALHAACWELSNAAEWADLRGIPAKEAWRELEPHREQLFEFDAFQAAGLAWMAVDPSFETPAGRRSRTRILHLLGTG